MIIHIVTYFFQSQMEFDGQFMQAFQRHDKNADGYITAIELVKLFKDLGKPVDLDQLETAFQNTGNNDIGPYSIEQSRSIYNYVLNHDDVSMASPKGSPMSDISEPSSLILDNLNMALEHRDLENIHSCVEEARRLLLKKNKRDRCKKKKNQSLLFKALNNHFNKKI
ncbi:uncharacterized protein LOC116341533 isoform X2 [Contarinia nasturtii]|uniref:uncharacterized protein LOC116341533 isoform X2 n=1 Tax=Contarinia nasturtii TaxID=265458 RepID=UPI0012D4135E|nr:uncharacterized protein LOC116341533 isoform X2 [Contarinia nasturtii]